MGEFARETQRLVLRDWRDDDWPEFWRVTNTPAVMRWLGGVADETVRAAARSRLENYHREHGHTFWVVERKDDGALLGFCGLKRSNQAGGPQGMMEVGWRLREDAWGQAYAREAAQASLAIAFNDFGVDEVIALTVDANTPSWGLMRRLGMQRRADMDFANADFDPESGTIIVYAITRQQWERGVSDALFTTERLILRRWREGDIALWLEHLNTPAVKEYLGGVQTHEQVAERFARMVPAWDADGFSFLAVERRSDGMFLGACGLAPIYGEAAPEPLASGHQVGWQFRADAWRKGYATEAAQAVVAQAFDSLGWDMLYAQTSERNTGSWKVMQRLGMVRRAELDYADPAYPAEDNPTMVWSMTRKDYLSR